MRFLRLAILILFYGCAPKGLTPCCEVLGFEEFQAESDLISQEGKYGILSLAGECFYELEPSDFEKRADVIGEGDRLKVSLFRPGREDLVNNIHQLSERINGFRIEEGELSVAGFEPVYVKGLTLKQAKEKISSAFQKEVKDVEVYLSFSHKEHNKIELMGMVRRDELEVREETKLYEVLSKAGIAPEANLFASYLVRDSRPLKVDMNRLVREGDMSQNIFVRPGDKLYIANALERSVLMMGELRLPRPIPVVTGSLSLKEALALSGGIPFTGDERHIHVIRGTEECPRIYSLSLNCILQESNKRLLLIPGDVVYVSQKPITKWNIFLMQLQPTLTAALTAKAIAEIR